MVKMFDEYIECGTFDKDIKEIEIENKRETKNSRNKNSSTKVSL